MRSSLFMAVLAILFTSVSAQDSTRRKETFNWLLFAEAYYSYDFNRPVNGERPSFLYNHKRHDETNFNLLLAKASWLGKDARLNVGLMAGNYSRYNLAAEPELLRHVFEATIGFQLSKKKELWLDAGILPSHIGFETAVSASNNTLTRSIAADNSPYYETGIKLGYTTPNGHLQFSALLLNGWQRIKRAAGNQSISAGTQVSFTPNEKITLNWSSFLGNDKPDSIRQTRFFNNFYAVCTPHPQWNITAGFDIGWQKKLLEDGNDWWLTPVCVVQFKASAKWSITARGEHYNDKNHVIIQPEIRSNPFSVTGFSLNIDRKLGKFLLWRAEYRTLKSKEALFLKNNNPVKTNNAITTSFCFKFE